MPYLVVDNFSGGLDSRRHILSSKDGTLAVLKNAHITRGGEIEKRKAFAQFATLPSNTFGLETTADAVYVFGSAVAPTMPAGVTYQRLQHPDGLSMTGIVWSTVYGGKPFVIAEFQGNKRLCFWDGAIIHDFFIGVVSGTPILSQLASTFSLPGYSLEIAGNMMTISGPPARDFTVTANATLPATVTVVGPYRGGGFPREGKASAGYFEIASGTDSRARVRLSSKLMDANNLPGIRGIYVGGQNAIYWGPSLATGIKYSPTWVLPEPPGSNTGALFQFLRNNINSFGNKTPNESSQQDEYPLNEGFSAFWTAPVGTNPTYLDIFSPGLEGATANGKLVQIEFDTNPASVPNVNEIIDVATIAVSPYNPSYFIATAKPSTMAGGQNNIIYEVRVDGVAVNDYPVPWAGSNTIVMRELARSINKQTPRHTFTAESSVTAATNGGDSFIRVNITGTVADGALHNGKRISFQSTGDVTWGRVFHMDYGSNAYPGDPVEWTVEVGGTTSNGGKLNVTITDPLLGDPYIFGASRVVGLQPNFSITYKAKEYAAVGSTMYFSSLNDATKWDIYDLGSGFIDMSNNFGGREDLTGFGVYQDKLAVFSRRNVQLWFLDADPAQNQQLQILANTGCIAPDSVVSMGAIDLLYLADNGIRSLRAREGTDTAFASDIGSAVDNIVTDYLATLTEAQKSKAKAIVDPIDGRYWLAIGSKIFVLSYFPGSNIAAWSTYETGFTVDEFATKGNQLFARSGNIIYLYGGADGSTYDASEVVVEFPYMDARKPAHYKRAKAIDLTIEGLWRAEMGFDHTNPEAREVVLRAADSTFAYGTIPVAGIGTHFGLRLVNSETGPAMVSNVIVHYDDLHPKHEAG